jgi:hypothetical protein
MKKLLILIPIAFSIVACSKQEPNIATQAEQQVRSSLKDPASAQFRNTYDFAYFGGRMVCGEVNAKNGFGGYTGFLPYSIVRKPHGGWAGASVESDAKMAMMVKLSCGYWQTYVREHGLSDRMPTPADKKAMNDAYKDWVIKTYTTVSNAADGI